MQGSCPTTCIEFGLQTRNRRRLRANLVRRHLISLAESALKAASASKRDALARCRMSSHAPPRGLPHLFSHRAIDAGDNLAAMHHTGFTSKVAILRARLMAWFGLVAVFSALLAPAAMLAEEVRTGKLGGLCSTQSPATGDGGSNNDAALPSARCDWCGSAAFAMPPAASSGLFAPAPDYRPQPAAAIVLSGARLGLPFSRGPPALLI
jgi:hypothetical protein